MSLLNNIFGGKPATQEPAAAPTQQQPAQQSQQPAPTGTAKVDGAQPAPENTPAQTPGTAPNGVVPAGTEENKSPLDQFSTLWETDPDAQTPGEFTPEQLDPAKLQEVVSKANMTSVITPELQQKIAAGGEEATQALQEAMNLVAQNTLMQSTTVANKMVESQVTKALQAMEAKIPQLVRDQSVNSALQEANPLFSNPAVAPVISAVKSQLQVKYPNATPKELTTMAQDFVQAMGSAFNPQTSTQDSETQGNEIDWDQWMQQSSQALHLFTSYLTLEI